VEIDPALAARLAERFAGDAHVRVITGDVLELPLEDILDPTPTTVVANLPYNVASPVLFRLLELRARAPRAVLMLQLEMAERLTARPGSKIYGASSVLVQAFAEVRIAFRVSRRSFLPPPDVDSAVVDVRWSQAPRADVDDPELFRAVVRAAFGQRRKMLRNALRPLVEARGAAASPEEVLRGAKIDPAARAETLDLAAFARLTRALQI
jgi:16S rRNA (adenine1518-N6/adenine1519-N6)-dimethyltransferase